MESTMKMQNLTDVLADELKDMYSAENQILKALPKMAKVSEGDLRTAFQQHEEQTRTHVQRLEQICQDLNMSPKGKKCEGIQGIIEEGSQVLSAQGDKQAVEAALIGAAQRVEHYEIAAYGTAKTHAHQLGYDNAANLLEQTLREERQTDDRLTQIAENRINPQSMQM
jgi:YD repeat-containing protein